MKTAYAYWLSRIKGIGDQSIFILLSSLETPECIYENARKEAPVFETLLKPAQRRALYQAGKEEPERAYETLQKMGIRVAVYGEDGYPKRLLDIPDPPYLLYVKGEFPQEDRLSVAVIGARECSAYGSWIGEQLGKVLGQEQIQVISGMARGIDGISQMAALEAGGRSFGVLGCSVDVCYPEQNRRLYEELLEKGGLISAYPPTTQPKASLFPPRNRIVSGLADVLVVVEARERSGTSITVDMALEQGREVYAVPGRVTDRLSDGCHRLLKQGAGLFLSPQEFLEEMRTLFPYKRFGQSATNGLWEQETKRKEYREGLWGNGENIPGLSEEENRILRCLEPVPKSERDLLAEAGVDFSESRMKQFMTGMLIRGAVRQPAPGYYCLPIPDKKVFT